MQETYQEPDLIERFKLTDSQICSRKYQSPSLIAPTEWFMQFRDAILLVQQTLIGPVTWSQSCTLATNQLEIDRNKQAMQERQLTTSIIQIIPEKQDPITLARVSATGYPGIQIRTLETHYSSYTSLTASLSRYQLARGWILLH